MRTQDASYPLKVTSRTISSQRTSKIRFSWFLIGTGFGVGSTVAVMMALGPALMTTASPIALQSAESAAVETAQAASDAESKSEPVTLVSANEPAPQAASPLASDDNQYPLTLSLTVKNGDTLIDMLTDAGVAKEEAYAMLETVRKQYDPKKLDVGKSISVVIDKVAGTPAITSLVLPMSLTSSLEVTRKDNSFDIRKIDVPLERKLSRASGAITNSLYQTGLDNGLPPSLLAEIINAYSYDVDFQRDIKHGDSIDVLFERMETSDGTLAGSGNMLYAELKLSGDIMKVYRYVDSQGNADYYNEKGESVRKALLRTPINGAKITSGYGLRNHPLLGYTKMHRGVDFGAPTGTPIYAAGDGKVEFASRKSGYGNYVRIKHNNTYSSAYGHISRFASGIKPGVKVKQGQIIAYVGSTGMSTGPHLHYEILANNQQVNPSNVKFKTGTVLKGKELAEFKKTMETVQARLDSMPKNSGNIAMLEKDSKSRLN